MVGKAVACCCAVAALAVLLGTASPAAGQPIPDHEAERISDGLYTFRWGAYRSLFVITDEGVIVTDPLSPQAASEYRRAIAALTGKPVRYVVYSHSHRDRVRGAQIFKAEGARVVAQEKCVDNLRTTPWPDVVMPDVTFSDRHSITLGKSGLDLYYFGPSYDNCMIVMRPRGQPYIFTVYLVQPPTGWMMPFNPLLGDFYLYNIVPYLKSVEALAAEEGITQVIGGFIASGRGEDGRPLIYPPAGPISVVAERRQFWEKVMAVAEAEVNKGTFAAQVPERVDLSQFKSLHAYNEQNMKILLWRVASYYVVGR